MTYEERLDWMRQGMPVSSILSADDLKGCLWERLPDGTYRAVEAAWDQKPGEPRRPREMTPGERLATTKKNMQYLIQLEFSYYAPFGLSLEQLHAEKFASREEAERFIEKNPYLKKSGANVIPYTG